MANRRGRSTSPVKPSRPYSFSEAADNESIINTRQIEAFGRTVHATASHLIASNFNSTTDHAPPDAYHKALSSVHKTLRRPMIQRSVFSFAKANPRELIRSNFNTSEIEHRAISYVPDELLRNIPASSSPFSLFEGFRASQPDDESLADKIRRRRHGKSGSKDTKLLSEPEEKGPPQLVKLKREKQRFEHRLEMMGVRKGMCAAEIREIDSKIENLNTMRQVLMERLADLEDEEHELDQQTIGLAEKIDVMQEELDDEAALASQPPVVVEPQEEKVVQPDPEEEAMQASFMSESVYEKLPKSKDKPKRRKPFRRLSSMPILHQNMKPGAQIREMQAHNDVITALDFDAPYGTMVTAALDDTVRVWDLNAGRCMGLLEGHLSSVRCLQVEENLVATGSMDASIKLWDLSQADYNPSAAQTPAKSSVADLEETDDVFTPATEDEPPLAQTDYNNNAMEDCHLFTLSAHVAEITALHFRDKTLVSGSADKTLRQWDLEKGRCIQTLDVLWAAAQASSINPNINAAPGNSNKDSDWWRPTGGRVPDAEADFIGALQVFETALACGTADGMVRLWDLRGANVVRSLIGHTGPITALQFDDHFLVTSSRDRSIRVWDLRTGGIRDVFAYDNPITSMMFDARRIVSAAGESVVKVYDKTDGRHWDCGAGVDEVDEASSRFSTVERVRIKDGYLVEGRRDGMVGIWSC